jgi:hypothetical protein
MRDQRPVQTAKSTEAANAARGKCVTPQACLRHEEAKRPGSAAPGV